MGAGLLLGLRRPAAARFSFLLSAPIILGAGLAKLLDLVRSPIGDVPWGALLVGFLAAAISGYVCIRFFLTYLKRRSLYPFAVYCALLGAVTLILAAVGWLR